MVQRLTDQDPAAIGPYRLIARIGHGGMGIVYLAESDGGENIAIKVLRAELARDRGAVPARGRGLPACRRGVLRPLP